MKKPDIKGFDKAKVVAENRRARFDYFVEERFEAGIELISWEECPRSHQPLPQPPHGRACTNTGPTSRHAERWRSGA